MNGLGLLVVLAAVGVDVGWESTSSGNAYTIRIQALVIDSLAKGDAIESLVKKTDRDLRKFRVVVGPRNPQTERVAAVPANEVDYGWNPNETNGIDYYVQISRERLETLARGIPLECEVHPDVPEIERIYVFVGDKPLPRELPKGVRSSTPTAPRDLSTIDNSRGGNVAMASGTNTSIGAPRYGDSAPGTQSNAQANVADPNRNSGYASQTSQSNATGNQNYGPQPPYDYGNQNSSSTNRYGQFGDNTLPVPPLDNSRAADYDRNRDLSYDYNRNLYLQQQDLANRQQLQQTYSPQLAQTAALPTQPQYNLQPGQNPAYGNQTPTYATGTASNPATDALAATLAFTQAQLEKAQLEKAQLEKAQLEKAQLEKSQLEKDRLANAITISESKVPAQEVKSSKPLILTTLALFASIGANAYLGWLAWSFFWRFRDAASDLSRARSNAFPSSSLAGH